jgi:hypothetical protein
MLTLKEIKTFYKFIPDKLIPEVLGLFITLLYFAFKSKKRSFSESEGYKSFRTT